MENFADKDYRMRIAFKNAEKIIDLYTKGEKLVDIQGRFGLFHDDIGQVLSYYGIPRRGTPKKPPKECTLPKKAFACYGGVCKACGWNENVHLARVEELRFEEKTKHRN